MANSMTASFNGGMVEYRKTCDVTGELYAVDVPYDQYVAWREGALIQRAMPQLTPDQREFLISHTTPAEWKELFKEHSHSMDL